MNFKIYNKFTNNSAFTMIELSVVLVVIGLILGSVIAANTIVESARISKSIKELVYYSNAVKNFREKYNYYPGDMPNASDVIPNCTSSCNGNGNGYIDTDAETLRAWQQLGNSGFIDKQFGSSFSNASEILPKSSMESAYYAVRSSAVNGVNRTYIEFGRISNQSRGYADVSTLTVEQALSIDSKIDDGIADSGNVIAQTGLNPSGFGALSSNACVDTSYSPEHFNRANNTNFNKPVVCKILYFVDQY